MAGIIFTVTHAEGDFPPQPAIAGKVTIKVAYPVGAVVDWQYQGVGSGEFTLQPGDVIEITADSPQ